MSTALLLGIDIGTTATKVILIDIDGHILAEMQRPATLYSPNASWAEEEPLEWWQNVCAAIPECLQQAGVQAKRITGIGVSGMVPTTILVGPQGQPIRRSIQQNDARSHVEIEYFKSQLEEADVFRRTGAAVTQQSIGPKLLWLSKHEPENLQRATWVMGSYDYINFLLCGQPSIEQNWALESGLYNLERRDWDDDLLALSNISRQQLPIVYGPSQVIGHLTAQAARATGLLEGTPVVAGSADHVASAFSSGVKENGDLLVKLGGAGDILYSLNRLEVDPRLFIDYHVIPGLYLINGCMASSGSIIKWFRNNFAPGMDYVALDEEAAEIPAGSSGLILLPYFIGEKTPIFDPLARGILFGLTLQHNRAHIYRAILEGVSFGFNHHLQILAERGFSVNRVRVSNGGARSKLWRQITADVLGLQLEEIAHHPGSSLGAAFVAGIGAGAFTDWIEIEKYIKVSAITSPDLDRHAKYRQLFDVYRDLYESNKHNYIRLAKIEEIIN